MEEIDQLRNKNKERRITKSQKIRRESRKETTRGI